jgi:ribonucleoside-diphosphate reductase alpha chain
LGKAGGCASAQNEAISRLVSLLMSMGIDSKLIYYQLRGIRCPASAIDRGEAVLSCSDAISKVFERELGFKRQAKETPDIPHQLFSKGDAEDEITEVTELFSHSSLITHNP